MKDRHLWLRISNAQMPAGFSEKVAAEFGWNTQQTTDAIEEYRRFAYLSQISNDPLSPPREVDLVWHMHVLYTRHYTGPWQDLLGQPLHHEPAPAGAKENAFREQYGRTRALYLSEFDSFGTDKLWPSVSVLRRREVFALVALASLATVFVAGGLAFFMESTLLGALGMMAFLAFFVSIFFAASANGGTTSFGVSSGGGGGDSGCGD